MNKKLLLGGALLLCCVVPAQAQLPSQDETQPYLTYGNMDEMLGWEGDPVLQGRVKELTITQRDLSAGKPGNIMATATLEFNEDGSILRETLEYPKQYTMRTEYGDERITTFITDNGESVQRQVPVKDETGRLVQIDYYRGDAFQGTEQVFTYDERGNLSSARSRREIIDQYYYDGQNRLFRQTTAPDHVPGAPFYIQEWKYDAAGRIAIHSEQNRHPDYEQQMFESLYEYDAQGRLISLERNLLTGGKQVQSREKWEYDGGPLVRRSAWTPVSFLENTYTYDEQGRVSQIERVRTWTAEGEEEAGEQKDQLSFVYDEKGNWTECRRESSGQSSILTRKIVYY